MADMDLSDGANDDSDDSTYGHSKKASKVGQRRRRSSLASVRQQLLPAAETAEPPDADFVPLTDLKGAAPASVVGRRIRCWYTEVDEVANEEAAEEANEVAPPEAPRSTLRPAIGVVTYFAEEGRMSVVYDADDDCDGWWVDGVDEWEWADPMEVGPPPAPPPVAGGWRSREATDGASDGDQDDAAAELLDVDKIFLVRVQAAVPRRGPCSAGADEAPPPPAAAGDPSPAPPLGGTHPSRALELFVKWKGAAHIHSQWVPRAELVASGPHNRRRVGRFLKEVGLALPGGLAMLEAHEAPPGLVAGVEGVLPGAEDAYSPEFDEVDRVIASRPCSVGGAPEWLVKWRSLPHTAATWESCRTMLGFQQAIQVAATPYLPGLARGVALARLCARCSPLRPHSDPGVPSHSHGTRSSTRRFACARWFTRWPTHARHRRL